MTRSTLRNSRPREGQVARLVSAKNFGFIRATDGQEDFFFHGSDLVNCDMDSLVEGDRVKFLGGETEKGFRAAEVTRLPLGL